ncbi:MAG: hypothetical protein EA351_03900 [Gemmatimonadales bacterium]|nr:MAG: hypothetical protein EA351_03900 [Gemmatimonadales bacterium]
MDRFTYLMLRLHRPVSAVGGEEIRGVVEHLDTGTKRTFVTEEELMTIVRSAAGPSDNIRISGSSDKTRDPAPPESSTTP